MSELSELDNLDANILLALMKYDGATAYNIAKYIYNKGDGKRGGTSSKEFKSFEAKVGYRVKRLEEAGLIAKEGSEYKVLRDRVFFDSGHVKLHQSEIEMPLGYVLVVLLEVEGELYPYMRQVEMTPNGNDLFVTAQLAPET